MINNMINRILAIVIIGIAIAIALFLFSPSLVYAQNVTRTITDPVGNQETWVYQQNLGVYKILSKTSLIDAKSISRQYDANNNLISTTDAEGRITTYTYNATNQRTAMTVASGTLEARTTTYEYISADVDIRTKVSVPSISSSLTKETVTTYDANQNPLSVTINGFTPGGSAISRSTSYTYNAIGQVLQIDGPRTAVSDITTFVYNDCTTGGGCGQLASVSNSLGQTTTYDSYDAGGLLLQSTNVNGTQTAYVYDSRQRVSSITVTPISGSPRTTTYTYDNVGQVTQVVMPDGLTITNTYDAARYLTAVEDNQGNRIEYAYDLKGNRIQTATKDSLGTLERILDTAYDHRDQVVQINAAGSITDMVKDAVGNTLSQTDPNSNPSTSNTYDPLDRLNQYIDSIGGQTSYGYDVQDQLTQVTTPNGATTTYVYDDLGNLLSEASPDRGTTTYTHDAAGNVLTTLDARGVTATYSYDALNRLTTIDYLGTDEDVTFVFDSCANGIGRLCQTTDQSGVTDMAYDGFGNVVSITKVELTDTYVTAYAYDPANRIDTITYPSGRVITYQRDSIGRVSSVQSSDVTNSLVYNRSYRADGNVISQTYGSGLTEARSYDQQGRLTQQTLHTETIDYAYDANGNLITLDKPLENWGYDYDALDRLIDDLQGDTQDNIDDYSYQYDGNGNRETENTALYYYDANTNRLNNQGGIPLTTDGAGNLLTSIDGKSFSYNLGGRLHEYSENSTLVASYTYNAQGQRTHKVMGNTTTVYHYDLGGNLIAQNTLGDPISTDIVWVDGEPIAQVSNEDETIVVTPPIDPGPPAGPYVPPTAAQIATAKKILPIIYALLLDDDGGAPPPPPPAPDPDDKVAFIHVDHLNTPRIATDNGQTTVWVWEGKAFGSTVPNSDPDGDGTAVTINLRFPGQYYDAESDLYYNWNRYYDPNLGRYITSDPIGLQGGVNTYGYVSQNPLIGIDPGGLVISGKVADIFVGGTRNIHFDDLIHANPFVIDSKKRRIFGWWQWLGDVQIVAEVKCVDDEECSASRTWDIFPDFWVNNLKARFPEYEYSGFGLQKLGLALGGAIATGAKIKSQAMAIAQYRTAGDWATEMCKIRRSHETWFPDLGPSP